jgi:hypothetical protein
MARGECVTCERCGAPLAVEAEFRKARDNAQLDSGIAEAVERELTATDQWAPRCEP